MKYHIALACNDVIGELAGSRFLYSLDVFNKPRTAVSVNIRTGMPSFSTLLILVLLLDSSDSIFLKICFCQRVFLKKGILGAFKYLSSTFYLFVTKGFCAQFIYFWNIIYYLFLNIIFQ